MAVDFWGQGELFWTWQTVQQSEVWRAGEHWVSQQPILAEVDTKQLYTTLLAISSIFYSLMSARKVLSQQWLATRLLGSWVVVSISSVLVEVLLGSHGGSSALRSWQSTALFLAAFTLMEFPVTHWLLTTPLFRFFIFLFHGINKSGGMLAAAQQAAVTFPHNAVFASFVIMAIKAVATMVTIDLFTKLANPAASTAVGQNKLAFWLLPAAIFALHLWSPSAAFPLPLVGLLIYDLVVVFYLFAFVSHLPASSSSSSNIKSKADVPSNLPSPSTQSSSSSYSAASTTTTLSSKTSTETKKTTKDQSTLKKRRNIQQ